MRQAGIVAAAGVYAFDHHIDRLAEDHANARRLAEGLAEAGLPVDVDQVETNFVQLDAARLGLTADEAVARLRAEGVLLSFAARKDVLRAVTHLDISAEDIDAAIAGRGAGLQRLEAPRRARRRRADAVLEGRFFAAEERARADVEDRHGEIERGARLGAHERDERGAPYMNGPGQVGARDPVHLLRVGVMPDQAVVPGRVAPEQVEEERGDRERDPVGERRSLAVRRPRRSRRAASSGTARTRCTSRAPG